MRNIISDGTYIYVTFRTKNVVQEYRLQRRLASDGSIGAGCWDIDLSLYVSSNTGVSSICIDGGYIYLCAYDGGSGSGSIAKFDITDGSNIWNQSYPSSHYYKVREYGSYVYICGIEEVTWKPIIVQIDKSDGSIFYTFQDTIDFAPITAMDIDSTGFYVSIYDASGPFLPTPVPVSVIFKHINFSWSEIWSTTKYAPLPPENFNDIFTETLQIFSTNIVAVGYETEYIDPDFFSRGRRDLIDKTSGVITDTNFWPDTSYYSRMKGVATESSDIYTGGYKTVTIGDPNYDPDNSKWVMTRGNPVVI